MRGGPDLTAVGRTPEHTVDWLAAQIRDPKTHKPTSRMPAFGPEKLPDADLKALAAYLASRK
jgi:cbb3-type cytochrome oxidase cytochrome c subunit